MDQRVNLNDPQARPFRELRDGGLLWLINTTVFHPRGYALQLHIDEHGEPYGWSLTGDGTEPWSFTPGPDIDKAFKNAQQILAGPCSHT